MSRTLPFLLLTILPWAATAKPVRLAHRHSGDENPTTTQPAHGQAVGRVVLADGQPAEQVSVMVKGTTIGTSTEADGSFRLRLPAGKQTLAIAYLGYVTQEIEVDVPNRATVTIPAVTLAKSAQQLSEVKVTAGRTINQRPTSVSKMPIRPLDLPQAVVTVNQETLEKQQVLRLSDALVNVPGLYVTSTTGGTQEELGSRGFAYGSNNTFKNGVRFNNGIMPETSSLESMEVLKGSAAILYGNVAAGGVLNLVTKKPKFEQGGSAALRVGSFGFWKPMVDVYGAVGKSDKVAYRLNTSYEQANSYRDEVKSDRFYVNPSLLFKLTPKTDMLVEGDYLRDNRTPDFGIGAVDYVIIPSRSRFLNVPGALNATSQTSTTATLTSRLNDTWQVRAVTGFQHYDNELRSASRPTGSIVQGPAYGNWNRGLQRTETSENYFLAQLDLTGNFHTGFLGHTLLVGADADQYQTNTLAYTNPASPTSASTAVSTYDVINLLDLNREVAQPALRLKGFGDLERNINTQANTRRAGFYAQDLLSFSEKVKALVGLRWSYQETPSDVYYYNTVVNRQPQANGQVLAGTFKQNRRYDNAFSPRLGLIYQPLKTMSVFASYSNSFSPQANTVADLNGQPLPPSVIDQYEVGVKNDLFNGALSANVTAYRIVNSNQIQSVLPTDPRFATASNQNSPQELAGEVTSKGVEVDVQSKPYLGWAVIAGYSYNNTAYTNSNIYTNGSRLRYNPAHTANASLFYTLETGALKGLTAGVTGYYVGDKLAGRNPRLLNPADGKPWATADANKFISIPDYLLFDASLGYTHNRFGLRVKLANLLDELSYNMHDDNSVNPIAPRTFAATFSYKL
ncbi:TonB-dependent receptor [Hymenobacter busanensis]|uniref:TonB-dependent receptor n=1 Tax=Hymenobacter busanensis TaxID=2607656 RepID=A0A7L4ZT11_9BACT|nr:TonB-dependent receptor [Hymenobacter busanensis]KAA9327584.1 TonB-dependent receptor [Hymenobacter busanensis]QHJ06077.1 TonB-dependent receptor [Hymenobacter busanensis]